MGAAGSRRDEALGRGVRLGLSGAHPPRSAAEGWAQLPAESNAGRDGEKARVNQDPRSRPVIAGRPPSRAREAGRSGRGPRRGKPAEHRSDPRASDGLLVNWVFAPSGAQGAGPGIVSGGCADGGTGGPKYVLGELAGAGISLP